MIAKSASRRSVGQSASLHRLVREAELEHHFRHSLATQEMSGTAICERNIMTKRIATIALLALLLAGAASILSACNTMEGAGKDIQQGGKALEDSADRNK